MIINVDLGTLVPPGFFESMPATVVMPIVANIADAARAHWVRLAGAGLNRTKRDYIAGIQPVALGDRMASIMLVGALPNAIEDGMPAMDMHSTLLGPNVPEVARGSGQKGKYKKKDGSGYYRAIPFRHSTPGSNGAVGQPMGAAYKGHPAFTKGMGFFGTDGNYVGDATALGANVYGHAKKLKGTTGMPGGPVQYGQRLPAGLAPKLKAHHHSDIYAGMIKERKTYAKATQSQYTTFRTISTNSPGWQREATEGKHYGKQVAEYANRMAPKAIAEYLRDVLRS